MLTRWWAPLALAVVVLGGFWLRSTPQPLAFFDQRFYLGIGLDLVDTGRFTDGAVFGVPDPSGERPSGMRFVPLYPALVSLALRAEPAFRTAAACAMTHDVSLGDCARTAHVVRAAQFVMLVLIMTMVWWLGGAVIGSLSGAWIAFGLALPAGAYLLGSVNYVMTEMTTLLLTTVASCAAVAGLRSRRWFWVAGAAIGLAALTRPAFLYLGIGAVVAGLIAATQDVRRARCVALFAIGLALPLAPWIVRNAVVMGRPALSYGYDSHTLVQRISYDSMTWREYGLAYVCGLPDGNGLGSMIAGPGACTKFDLGDQHGTFYQIGIGPMLDETLRASGGYQHHLSYLLREYIAKMPIKHVLVSIPLALRGAWVDHYWGLVLGLVCAGWTVVAARRRDWRFLILALPAWFMLAFHAAVAVNQVRYNLMLIPPYAVAGAALLQRRLA